MMVFIKNANKTHADAIQATICMIILFSFRGQGNRQSHARLALKSTKTRLKTPEHPIRIMLRFFTPSPRGLTLTLSQREGAPLNWRPSADAVAGNGRPLSYSLRSPSADAVAGGGDQGSACSDMPCALSLM